MAGLPPLPEGWEERRDPQGNAYYVDHINKQTSWRHPGVLQQESQQQQQQQQQQSTAGAGPTAPVPPTTTTTTKSSGSNSFFNRSGRNQPTPVVEAASTSALDAVEERRSNSPPRRRRSVPAPSGSGTGARGRAAVGRGQAAANGTVDRSREEVTFAPHSIPDDDRSQCAVCGERFAALRRRHHCRCCGEVVCATCSPTKQLMHIAEPGYERPRRACQACAAHLSAGDHACNARYALAIATPGADMYHKQAAVRHLSASMEAEAKSTVKPAGGGGGGGAGIVGPLSAIERVHGGPRAVFEALVPMMSTEVPLDVCAHACQLLGASLFVASRAGPPEKWASLASVVPETGVDGLLECLRVAPARAKAARALFYAAKAPLAGGAAGELIESRGGVTIMLEVLASLPVSPPTTGAAAAEIKGLRVWLCATLQPVIADRPRAVQAFLASRGVPLLCRQLVAGPADIAVHACGVIASALRRGGSGSGSAIEAVEADIIPPLLGMLAGGSGKDTHSSALAMELLVLLAAQPPVVDRLRAAGTIPAVAACLDDPAAPGTPTTRSRASLMQLALIVLTSFLRGDLSGASGAGGEVADDIAATGAHVRAVSLLSSPDPMLRFPAAELVLHLARRCRRAPAPAYNPSLLVGGGAARTSSSSSSSSRASGDIAKDIIEAGGLGALWTVCSDPSPMARPVALEALAVMLGTAAAMSRSTASSEAVLALVSEGAAGTLVREHVDPALAVLASGGGGGGGTGDVLVVATFALLALHFLACNPDPGVYGLFVVAAGVDDAQGGTGVAGRRSSGGGSSTWNMILSSVESGADGRAGPAFLEAALLAAGSVCGAPPLPALSSGTGTGAPATPAADEVARILPTYQARAETTGCLLAAAAATSRGLAARAVALLDAAESPSAFFPKDSFPTTPAAAAGGGGDSYSEKGLASARMTRAAIRVVWSLSRGPSSAALAAHGTLPRLMDRMSSSRRRYGDSGGGGGRLGGLRGDAAAGVLVLDTIAAFLKLEDKSTGRGDGANGGRGSRAPAGEGRPPSPTVPVSPSTASTIRRTVDELCELVMDGTSNDASRDDVHGAAATDSLGPRSLSLLATAAANPRLRPMLVDSPKFPGVLDLLLLERHLDGASSSSLQVALGALSVVGAAVSEERTATRLIKLGLVSKLASLVRLKPTGPPPPLPPRRGSGAGAGDTPPLAENPPGGGGGDGAAESARPPPPGESVAAPAVGGGGEVGGYTGRREEACAALRVLEACAGHDACVPLILESEDLGCLLQVIREAVTLPLTAAAGGSGGSTATGGDGGFQVKTEMREEVEDALLCLLSLTEYQQRHPQHQQHQQHQQKQRTQLNRSLGLVATSPAHPGLDALLHLAAAEGGTALQVVFQMVAAETPDAVAVSPVLRALGEGGGRHAAVLVRLLGPTPYAWQGRNSSPHRDSVVKAARARACGALRHAWARDTSLHAIKNQMAAETCAISSTSPLKEETAPGDSCSSGRSSGEVSPRGAAAVVGGGGGGSFVDAVPELFPLVLSLAGTNVEGARCLRAMFAAGGGVGEAAQAAAFGGGGGGDAARSKGDGAAAAAAAAAGGIRTVVSMLNLDEAEIRAAGASILRKLAFATPPLLHPSDDSAASSATATAAVAPAAAATAAASSSSPAAPCQALLESLHACGGRSEAIRSLASLGLFGDDPGATPRGGGDDDIGNGGGGGGGGGGRRRKKAAAQEARWKRQLRDDGAAVLVAMVGAITSASTAATATAAAAAAAAAASGSGGGSRGSWRQRHQRRGSGSGRSGADAEVVGAGMEGFDYHESEALSGVCVEALRALATDALTSPLEKARCLSLLSDLALNPRCARTLFRGGAVPQMLLNAQGCKHVDLIDVHGGDGMGGGGGGDAAVAGPDGRVSLAGSVAGRESDARSCTTTEGEDDEEEGGEGEEEEEEEEEQQAGVEGVSDSGGRRRRRGAEAASCCRCRQAMRLLARLVRGLPGETPAVVVRHSGLQNIVQILKDGAAEAEEAAAGDSGRRRVPAATEAAVREALELFVALSEQAVHRRALVNTPGLLRSASSYAVSSSSSSGTASSGTASPSTPPPASTQEASAQESAFRLLGNLAFADGPRRRIAELDGLVLAASGALSASASALTTPPPPPSAGAPPPPAAGEAAAALLGRLAPVLGAEAGEMELVAAGEALSAALAAVVSATGGVGGSRAPPSTSCGGRGEERLVGAAREALSGLLVLSWSDSSSLEAAAAVDTLVTDAGLAESVVSLWRQATAATAPPEFGTLSESSLAMMSSIACRSTGRQALVAAGVASAVVDVALRRNGGGGGGSSNRGGENPIDVAERGDILRLLCVLCATPAHRVSIRSSLATSAAAHEIMDGARRSGKSTADVRQGLEEEQEEEEEAVEAAIAGLWGAPGVSRGEAGYAEACRLALLLGVSPPAAPIVQARRSQQQHARVTAAGAGAFAAGHLSSPLAKGRGSGIRVTSKSPPDADEERRSTSATTNSPSPPPPAYRDIGDEAGRSGRTAGAGFEEDAASMNSQDLEEALYPSTAEAAAPASSGSGAGSSGGAPTPAWQGRPASQGARARGSGGAAPTPASVGGSSGGAPSRRVYPRPLPPPPTAAPPTTRSKSEESLHRLLSEIARAEGEESAAAAAAAAPPPTTSGSFRGSAGTHVGTAEERDRLESRRAGAGVYVGDGGGSRSDGVSRGVDGQGDDRVACGSCGELVYAPRGFDLALIDCPHCRQAVG